MYLTGHKAQPTYALGWSTVKPILASGSKNGSIAIWNLEGHINATKGFQPDSGASVQKPELGVRIDKQMSSVGSQRKTRGNPESLNLCSQVQEAAPLSDESGESEDQEMIDQSSDLENENQKPAAKQKCSKTL